MKHLKIIILNMAIVALSSLYLSCNKDTPLLATTVPDLSKSATVQVFTAALKAARNYVYVDGVPVSGAPFSYGGVFPATAFSFRADAGSRTFLIKDTLPATTQIPLTFTQTVEAGKNYTVFTYDTITSIKQVTVVNDIVVPKDTTCMLRFANFVYNPTAIPNVDVYSYRRISGTPVFASTAVYNGASVFAPVFTGSTPVFSNVASSQATAFIPYASGLTDTLYVFATGTTSPLLSKGFITSLVPTRSYTSAYNGSYRGNLAARVVTTFASY
ncbi:MAG: DUF4397 domain-containing protein [Ferruginibacter sp.]